MSYNRCLASRVASAPCRSFNDQHSFLLCFAFLQYVQNFLTAYILADLSARNNENLLA